MHKLWNHDDIVELAKQGKSARYIQEALKLPVGVRRVQEIMRKYRTYDKRRTGRLDSDSIGTGNFRDIVRHVLIDKLGKNPKVCEQCRRYVPKGCDIHHTKYKGATIHDLQFVCRRCNTQPENVGLE